jgi:predicted nucleotidyltransferase
MDDPIRDTLATYPQVAYALLFGSNATSRGTSFSDIDIAIGLRPGARLERQA